MLLNLKIILALVDGAFFVKPRRRIALTLLYLTGLDVSNLLLFNVGNLKELLEKGCTSISLIKGGEKRFNIKLTSVARKLLNLIGKDCTLLTQNRTDDQFLFTTLKQQDKVIRRELFNAELNSILKNASFRLHKNLRTHSFRATFINDLLKHQAPIDQVKEIVDHKAIASTLEYKRVYLTQKQAFSLLKKETRFHFIAKQ